MISTFTAGFAEAGSVLQLSESAASDLEQALEQCLERGRTSWPHLGLDPALFVQHLGRCVAAAGAAPEPASILRQLTTVDLYLACAAGYGNADAIEVVCGYVETAVRQIAAGRAAMGDIVQILRQRLCLAEEGRPPKILTYWGRAPLEAWLAAVAHRTAISLARTDGAEHRMQQRLAAEAALASQDPELQAMKSQYENEFKQALQRALDDLSDRSRTLLRLHVFAGQSLDHLAAVYDVHSATISRWFARAQGELLDRTAHHMHHDFGVGLDEFPSLVRVMASQINVSIARLLEEEPRTTGPTRR